MLSIQVKSELKTFYFSEKSENNLCPYLTFFVDETKSLTIENVASPSFEQNFIPLNKNHIQISFKDANYWYKCKLKNISNTFKNIIIEFKNPIIDKVKIYTQHYNIIYPHEEIGDLVPFKNRKVKYRHPAFELSIKPYEEYIIYIRITNNSEVYNIPVNVYNPSQYREIIQSDSLISAILFGIIFTVLFSNILILLMLRVKKSIYINFSIYLTVFGLFYIFYDGLGFQYIIPQYPKLNNFLIEIFLAGTIPAITAFSSEYLDYGRYSNLFRKITFLIHAISGIFIILILLQFKKGYIILGLNALYTMSLIFIMYTSIRLFNKNPKLNFVILLSTIILISGGIFASINLNTEINEPILKNYPLKIAFSLQAMILTVGLSLRLKILQDRLRFESISTLMQLNNLKEQQTKELEKKVEERTKELTEKNLLLEKLSFVAQQTNNSIMIFDNYGNLEWVNDGFTRLLGYTLEEYIELRGRNIIDISKNPEIKSLLEKIITTKESLQYESYEYKKNGEIVWLQTTLSPIFDSEGNFYKYVSIDSDITKLKEAEEQIRKQKEDLEEANKRILEISKAKETFLANTSHEIRTPLNAIIGYINLLAKEKKGNIITEKILDYIRNIKISADNLLVIINDILDISKIEAGKLNISKIDFSIIEQVQSVISTMNIKALEKNIKLIHNFDEKIPKYVKGDPYRLSQILTNLISNAIKFTNEGGLVTLEINKKYEKDNNVYIEFVVSDNGIGIALDKQQKIFESFTQADDDISRKYGGTGLGLAIVKRLTELQNGEIHLESTVGVGSTFKVTIPYEISNKKEEKRKLKKIVTTSPKCINEENINILLVEDNEINREIFIDTVKSYYPEIKIDIATDGYSAIDKLKVNDYTMMFMDVQMPGLSGIETAKLIRTHFEDDKKKNIPIIALTADAFIQEKEKCLNVGMNAFITKPFQPEELFQHISIFACLEIKEIAIKEGFDVAKEYCSECTKQIFKTKKQTKYVEKNNNLTIELDVLDLSLFNKIYKNDTTKIKTILQMYNSSLPSDLTKAQETLDKKDFNSLRAIVHSLKTKFLYLGLNNASNICKEIELMIMNNNIDEEIISKNLSTIKISWDHIQPQIEEIINS